MHNLYLFYRLNLATLKTRGKQKPEKPIKLRKLEKNNRKNRTVKKNRLNRLEFWKNWSVRFGSVWFWFISLKPKKPNWTEPKSKKNRAKPKKNRAKPKKPCQTGKKPRQTEKNHVKSVWNDFFPKIIEPKPVDLNQFRFGFGF